MHIPKVNWMCANILDHQENLEEILIFLKIKNLEYFASIFQTKFTVVERCAKIFKTDKMSKTPDNDSVSFTK